MNIIDNFYSRHPEFEINGHRGRYIQYLDTILPEGQLVEHETLFYYVENTEVHRCGTPEDYAAFIAWLETYDENDSWGPSPDD